MEIGKIIAIGLVGTIFAVLLKKENPQLAMLLAAVTGILIFGIICVPLGRLIGLLRETAETAGVGGVMGGAVETAAAMAGTLKSGTLVAAVVLLLLLCLPLLIKLLVILLVFRLTAAAAEFICEERLVECIAAAGEYIGLLLGIVFLGEGMFFFSALLLLGGL